MNGCLFLRLACLVNRPVRILLVVFACMLLAGSVCPASDPVTGGTTGGGAKTAEGIDLKVLQSDLEKASKTLLDLVKKQDLKTPQGRELARHANSLADIAGQFDIAAKKPRRWRDDVDPRQASDKLSDTAKDLTRLVDSEGLNKEVADELVKVSRDLTSHAARLRVAAQTSEDSLGKHLVLSAGVVTLNPYKIDDDFKVVSTGENDVKAFVELLFRDRAAWLDIGDRSPGLDYEARFGYVFEDGEASGSTIAGSGDVFMELNAGLRLCRLPTSAGSDVDGTLNFELFYAMVTDRHAQDIHHQEAAGFTWVLGVPRRNGHRKTEMLFGVYGAFVEVPDFVSDETLEVKKLREEFPRFDAELGVMLRADIRIPVGQAGFLTFAGRHHAVHDLNPWSFWIGYTVTTERIAALFD